MKIEILEGHAVIKDHKTYREGEVLDLPSDKAKVLIEKGTAKSTSKSVTDKPEAEEPKAADKQDAETKT